MRLLFGYSIASSSLRWLLLGALLGLAAGIVAWTCGWLVPEEKEEPAPPKPLPAASSEGTCA